MTIFAKSTPPMHLAAAVFAALLPLLSASGCLRLEPSPLQDIGPLVATSLPAPATPPDCGKTFYAYSGSSATFYSYDRCNGLQTRTLRGPTGLVSVAKTTAGFVGLDASAQVFVSTDGTSWNRSGTFSTGTAPTNSARVAACGDTVVVAYPNWARTQTVQTLVSGDGGRSLSAGAQVSGATTGINDLICDGGRFHISTGDAAAYMRYSDTGGASWVAAANSPNWTSALQGIGVSRARLVTFFAVNAATLTLSTDTGATWSDQSAMLTINSLPPSITFNGSLFLAPLVAGGVCRMARSTDASGTAWDDSISVACGGIPALNRAASDAQTAIAVGAGDSRAGVGMLLLSSDGGATWTQPVSSGAVLNDVVAF